MGGAIFSHPSFANFCDVIFSVWYLVLTNETPLPFGSLMLASNSWKQSSNTFHKNKEKSEWTLEICGWFQTDHETSFETLPSVKNDDELADASLNDVCLKFFIWNYMIFLTICKKLLVIQLSSMSSSGLIFKTEISTSEFYKISSSSSFSLVLVSISWEKLLSCFNCSVSFSKLIKHWTPQKILRNFHVW